MCSAARSISVSIPPPASSAGSVLAKRSAPGTSATYSGLMPSRSRASTTRPLSRSTMTTANIPSRCSANRSPHVAYALSTTSVSPLLKKR